MGRPRGAKDLKQRKRKVDPSKMKTGRLCGIKCLPSEEEKIKKFCSDKNISVSEFFIASAILKINQEVNHGC